MHHITQFVIVVHDYDEAVRFYVGVLGFELIEDSDRGGGKRWVRVRPRGPSGGCAILLAKAADDRQRAAVGNQTGGRVFIFLHTDDFMRDYNKLTSAGVKFRGPPRREDYGTVAVFEDPYGNAWDLIEPPGARTSSVELH